MTDSPEACSMRNVPVLIGAAIALMLFMFAACTETVSAEETPICRGSVATITITLLQNGTYGNPVSNQPVEFFDQTLDVFLGLVLTDVDGRAQFEWSLPADHPLGPTVINATYRGNETLALAPSFQWTSLTVLSSTRMDIQVERSTVFPGEVVPFTVLLLNDMNLPLPYAQLTVFCNSVPITSRATNSSGWARFTVQCNDSWARLGENEIRVAYEQNLVVFNEAVAESFMVTVEQVSTSVEVTKPPLGSYGLNDTLRTDLFLRADDGALPGARLQVALDGVSLAAVLTDDSGVAHLCLVIDGIFTLGPHRLTFEYPGNSRYASCSHDISISVLSSANIRIILQGPVIVNTDSNITIEIRDLFHRPIQNATIILRDLVSNETFAGAVPIGTTSVSFSFHIVGRTGARSFLISIVGNEYVTNRTSAFSTLVWSRPDLILVRSNIRGYASPSQQIMLEVRLYDSQMAYTDTLVESWIDNTTAVSHSFTNSSGFAIVELKAPQDEGLVDTWIVYSGNLTVFRMSNTLHYTFTVSRIVPLAIELHHYTVIMPLLQLEVVLMACALNGSLLEGVTINYEWLSIRGSTESTHDGLSQLYLPVPGFPGSFILSYWTESSSYTLSCSGHFVINLNGSEVAAAQGVGITGMAASICVSLTLAAIPIIRKRYLLD
ncbi:MAG: hypothetical protein C4K49_04445 [Candidatus Thorarchaeota archaeon]|nr:MAG: hypothetical protein C4K49_04445 [Candidatus Thorarchaeota archaeon]